jgi:hypothetical protein
MMTAPPTSCEPPEPRPVPGSEPIPELTEQLALEIGGWDIRYARVLAIALDGPVGVSVIDPNGDANVTETEHVYLDETGRWCAGGSSGGGTSATFGVHGLGWYPGVRYAYGRAEHPGPQTVTYRARSFDVLPGPDGWWAVAEAVGDDEDDITAAVWALP